ncbi:protein LURP-one-related 6 isoform X2 [Tripterygium wilfordii]|nr:protein LURP-one-related 6 isoform X2 [Tripterygium wilfordii]
MRLKLFKKEKQREMGSVSKANAMMPIISKMYCSSSQTILVVRRRPHVVNGGGFVVTDCSQKVVFKVDGCGALGATGELVLRDSRGDALLLIRRKGGMIEALSTHRKWKGYAHDYEGSQKLVFCLREPNSCFVRSDAIRVAIKTQGEFEIKGSFPDKDCTIVDCSRGNIIAQIGVKKEMEKYLTTNKDFYYVVVYPGIDQAFVFGVIAILDYMYGESTRC